ncbi:MAG: hypothetical protein QXK52_05500, partial [Candidatus Bathyarchaeia archaeon]
MTPTTRAGQLLVLLLLTTSLYPTFGLSRGVSQTENKVLSVRLEGTISSMSYELVGEALMAGE